MWRFPLDGDGRPGRGEIFIRTPDLEPNLPDLPAAKDGSKTLAGWVGRVQAVAVITPDGKSVRAMILGVPRNISSLAIGGDTLYIAVAGKGRLHKAPIR